MPDSATDSSSPAPSPTPRSPSIARAGPDTEAGSLKRALILPAGSRSPEPVRRCRRRSSSAARRRRAARRQAIELGQVLEGRDVALEEHAVDSIERRLAVVDARRVDAEALIGRSATSQRAASGWRPGKWSLATAAGRARPSRDSAPRPASAPNPVRTSTIAPRGSRPCARFRASKSATVTW